MKRYVFVFFIIFLLALILSNFSFLLREFIYSNFDFSLFNQENIIENIKDINTYKVFISKLDVYNFFSYFILMIYFISSLNHLMGYSGKKSYESSEKYGSHGTARFMNKKEIKKTYTKDEVGWYLGSIKKTHYKNKSNKNYCIHPVSSQLNMQINVVGPPGSRKTTGLVYPNIFHIPRVYKALDEKADFVITDPKSELFSNTSEYLENMGYEVRVLDFIHLKYGDCLNSLEFITEEKEYMEVAQGYVSAVTSALGGKKGGDPIWEEGEALLLGALIGFVKQKYKDDVSKQTFTEVDKLFNSEDLRDPEKAKNFFKKNGITGAAENLYNKFLAAEDKVRAGILIGLGIKLKLFAFKNIQNLTNKSTFDIKKIGRKKDKPIALFILMPDKDRTYAPIINVTITTILNQLYKTAYETNNKLEFPVYLILEEIANIGKISGLNEMLGTMRSRRIYPMMIWQSLSQTKDRYPNGWEDILSQCDTHIYLGVNDKFTAEYLANQLGKTTIKTEGISKKPDRIFSNNKPQSVSSNYGSRNLLMADEIMRFDNDKLIIRQRANYPSILYKVQYRYWEEKENISKFKKLSELKEIEDTSIKIEEANIEEDNKVFERAKLEKNLQEKEKTEEKVLEIELEVAEEIKTEERDITENDIFSESILDDKEEIDLEKELERM